MFSGVWRFFLNKEYKPGNFFQKSLILILLITSIPGLIIGLSVYWIVGGHIENELQNLHQSQLQQRAAYIDKQFSYLELSGSHWAFDPNFGDELKNLDFAYKYIQIRDIFQTLLIMEGSDPLIDHVELFLNEPRPVVFTRDRYTFLTDPIEIQKYASFLQQGKSIDWTQLFLDKNNQPSLTLYNKIPGGSTAPFGVILITLNNLQINDLLQTLTPNNQGSAFLMSSQGQWLLTGNGTVPSALDSAIRIEVLKQEGKSQSFLFKWQKMTYSVSFGHITRLGSSWTYVSAVPLSAITAPVVVISQVIVWISLAGLLVAAILSWFASRKLYSPVQRLVHLFADDKASGSRWEHQDEFALIENHWLHLSKESQRLQSRLAEQLPYLKEGYFLQLVQGYLYSFSEASVREKMEQYGLDVEDKQFIALMIHLSGFSNLQGRFFEGDEGLVTFVAANIVEEWKNNEMSQTIVINFHDLTIGLLHLMPGDKTSEQINKELCRFCEGIIRAIQQVLSLRVTISISKSSYQVKQIPYLFEEARQALSYRDLQDEQQIIGLDQQQAREPKQRYNYPFAIEKEIIHAIRMGLRDELNGLISRFLQELSAGGTKELIILQGMLQLLASIQHTILQLGISPVHLFEGTNLFLQLSQLRESDEMLKWFQHKVIEPFLAELDKKQDQQLKLMVEQVIHYMQTHYMNDISLESCADQIRINSYTLSKTFKQITGLNFIDYLTGIRIEKAKELLRLTDLKINDVAEKVGYQPSYFNRIFKKLEGRTPSQYREKNHSDWGEGN